jgi:group I intron endonuclease
MKNKSNVENVINIHRENYMSIIYKTTNNINGKIYVGKAKYNDESYLGSGVILRQAIEKYGKENFTKEILEECADNIVDEREKFWIQETNALVRGTGYNIATGGTGGDTTSHHPNKDDIVKKRNQKLSEWHASMTDEERQEQGKKISDAKKGKSYSREGYTHTQETIDKIKNNQPPRTEKHVKAHAEAMARRIGTSLTKKYKKVRVDGIEYESVKHAIQGLGLKYAKYFHDMRKNGKIKVEYL